MLRFALILVVLAVVFVHPSESINFGFSGSNNPFIAAFDLASKKLGQSKHSAEALPYGVSSWGSQKISNNVEGSAPFHSFFSSASAGQSNKESGWPLVTVKFDHPIQSPIDLITFKALTMDLEVLDIIEPKYDNVQAKIYNSGHTVYVYINEDAERRPYLTGGPLRRKFIFEQMHFHWGSEDIWGSEHFVDGESYAVEIHMVHYNSAYKNFKEAAKQPDGLAVLTIFAEATNATNPLLDPLYDLLPKIVEPKSSTTLDSNAAMQWASSALSINKEYFTYPGSLTTEPYSENVIFILLTTPIKLSFIQLSAFRKLHSDHGSCIVDNKRQLQPLHNRPIVRSTKLQ